MKNKVEVLVDIVADMVDMEGTMALHNSSRAVPALPVAVKNHDPSRRCQLLPSLCPSRG